MKLDKSLIGLCQSPEFVQSEILNKYDYNSKDFVFVFLDYQYIHCDPDLLEDVFVPPMSNLVDQLRRKIPDLVKTLPKSVSIDLEEDNINFMIKKDVGNDLKSALNGLEAKSSFNIMINHKNIKESILPLMLCFSQFLENEIINKVPKDLSGFTKSKVSLFLIIFLVFGC